MPNPNRIKVKQVTRRKVWRNFEINKQQPGFESLPVLVKIACPNDWAKNKFAGNCQNNFDL